MERAGTRDMEAILSYPIFEFHRIPAWIAVLRNVVVRLAQVTPRRHPGDGRPRTRFHRGTGWAPVRCFDADAAPDSAASVPTRHGGRAPCYRRAIATRETWQGVISEVVTSHRPSREYAIASPCTSA